MFNAIILKINLTRNFIDFNLINFVKLVLNLYVKVFWA